MQTWTSLARLALIGTEHQPPTQIVLGDASLDDVLAGLGSVEERESYLLKTGAALTLLQRAGYQPSDKTPTDAIASPETQPRCPAAAGQDLARMLRDYLPQVLPEWLELAEKLGVRAPEDLLPELLNHAKGKTELRARVRQITGQRGAWLAAQNADWSFAIHTGGDEKIWQEGKRAERFATLREIREVNPGRARELLLATWKDETPEDRAEFVQVLQAGLSQEDESFLDAALDDKRKEVRVQAVRLLSAIPQSKLVQRMTELATPLLQAKKQLLRGVSLEASLPVEWTKEMKRYGVGASSPPIKEIGEKAWWLAELLSVIPPVHWSKTLGFGAKELIRAAIKSEWRHSLLYGWAAALGSHPDSGWLQAWIDAVPGPEELLDYLPSTAIAQLPAEPLEAQLIKLLRQKGDALGIDRVVSFRLRLSHPWGEFFSTQVLKVAQGDLTRYITDYSDRFLWQKSLRVIALHVPYNHPQMISGWPKEIETNNVREVVDEFCSVIEFRRSIHRHFKEEN